MIIMTLFIFLIGLFPKYIFNFITLITGIYIENQDITNLINLTQIVSYTAFALILTIGILYVIKNSFQKNDKKYETWGCGYNKINNRMQYSALSYIFPFIKTKKCLFKTDILFYKLL